MTKLKKFAEIMNESTENEKLIVGELVYFTLVDGREPLKGFSADGKSYVYFLSESAGHLIPEKQGDDPKKLIVECGKKAKGNNKKFINCLNEVFANLFTER